MDKKYVINLQGRDFVTYDGLLDEATRLGLVGIDTELLQAPNEANHWTAIVKATAVFLGENGTRTFTGIGDANPSNVNRNIAPHSIRMAETRAKARALRDALNVKGCSFEELGADTESHDHAPAATVRHAESNGTPKASPNKPASEKQIGLIGSLMKKAGWGEQDGREYLEMTLGKKSRSELTSAEASDFIGYLQTLTANAEAS